MLLTILYSAAIGTVAGLLWGITLEVLRTGLLVGAIAGILLGILLGLFGKAATIGGNIRQSETIFVNSSILTMLAVLTIGSGVLAWLVRLIFF